MKKKWVSLVKSVVGVACIATTSVTAFAMPMLVEDGGQVIGIDDLVVGAETYDVQFVLGSCDSLFSGCDESLFTFTTQATAQTAADSILSAFVGHPVDEFPRLQFGIRDDSPTAVTLIPFSLIGTTGDRVNLLFARNAGSSSGDFTSIVAASAQFEFTPFDNLVYVTFQLATPVVPPPAVPTPASLLLALFGLAGMRLLHKRQRRQV